MVSIPSPSSCESGTVVLLKSYGMEILLCSPSMKEINPTDFHKSLRGTSSSSCTSLTHYMNQAGAVDTVC